MQILFPNPNGLKHDEEPALVNPLVLAYLGDTLYDLYVRTRLVCATHAQAGRLHKQAIHYVKAAGQARALLYLMDQLSEKELSIVKRGRNAKSPTVPKNSTITDYRHATAFEALLGYLYLAGETERAEELMGMAFEFMAKEDQYAPGQAQRKTFESHGRPR